FHDAAAAIPTYVTALETALQRARATQPMPMVRISSMEFHPDWHGLVLESNWLQTLTADFVTLAQSPTRTDALRVKDWLHLSLAYEFPSASAAPLERLARELVDIHAPVGWALHLYERFPADVWAQHVRWPLASACLIAR